MGGIALILGLVAVAALVAMVVAFVVLRGGTRQAHRLRGEDDGRRPAHDMPHPEQAQRERGTLFPS
ncbi:MAG TPA: hypothetical protein VHR88_07210 [Solirubrobacteraceae bacterium]|jgi:hypothetical protein|nr:hypothetical protein [Solirubrobacteraceae bacterium]